MKKFPTLLFLIICSLIYLYLSDWSLSININGLIKIGQVILIFIFLALVSEFIIFIYEKISNKKLFPKSIKPEWKAFFTSIIYLLVYTIGGIILEILSII